MTELIIAGAGLSAAASIFGADAAADAMEEQAAIQRVQAQIARSQSRFSARMQLKAGREQSETLMRESRRRTSATVVQVGNAGIEVSGSPLAIIGEQIRRDELEAGRVITNAHAAAISERASGESAALGFTASAAQLDEQADTTRVVGFLQAIGAGMNAAGSFGLMSGGFGGPPVIDRFSRTTPTFDFPS